MPVSQRKHFLSGLDIIKNDNGIFPRGAPAEHGEARAEGIVMAQMKTALYDLVEAIHPDDCGAQEDLQTRIISGQGLSTEEFAAAQKTEIGRKMIESNLVQEGVAT